MVKHVVMWKLREFDTPQARAEAVRHMKTGLESLVGIVPGLQTAQVGENFNPAGYDLALVTQFDTAAALEGYQCHPAHLKVKEFVHTVITQRAVCDWEE